MGTVVINLFGAPNSGKSTTAAGLYFQLKKKHTHCELVREYVKNLAWEGRIPGKWDQPYIASKQMKYESTLYDKVDFIVTDSPFLLSDWYETQYGDTNIVRPLFKSFLKSTQENGIKYINVWLDTVPHIDERGRYQTAEEIREMSEPMKKWAKQICSECNMELIELDSLEADKRISHLLSLMNL